MKSICIVWTNLSRLFQLISTRSKKQTKQNKKNTFQQINNFNGHFREETAVFHQYINYN